MSDWKKNLEDGRKCLCNEEFEKARVLLESALEGCPDDCGTAGEIVFDIGRAFFGMGMRGVAVKNMLTAIKLGAGEAHTENMMKCIVNEYGMPAQASGELNDRAAFFAVHLMRYFHSKKSGRFGTMAEKDMIFELLEEAWLDFRRCEGSSGFSGLPARARIDRFRSYVIFFPTFSVPDMTKDAEDSVIYADFGGGLCSCGSGLPYMWCCGRIKSLDELESGLF